MVYLDPVKIDFSTFLSEMRNPKDINSMPVFRIVGLKMGCPRGLKDDSAAGLQRKR